MGTFDEWKTEAIASLTELQQKYKYTKSAKDIERLLKLLQTARPKDIGELVFQIHKLSGEIPEMRTLIPPLEDAIRMQDEK